METFSEKGFWAVILGGSSGMGLATARKLAAEGMNLCIVHRDSRSALEPFKKTVSEIEKIGVKCLTFNKNALLEDEMNSILEALRSSMKNGDKIKVFLHSIAKGNLKPMNPSNGEDTELSEEDFAITLQSMATSYYTWIKAIQKSGMFAETAQCLGLTSEGNAKAWPNYAAISAAKAALEAISRSVALELGKEGIRSNIIQAGITETPSFKAIPGSEVLKKNALSRNPLQRLTEPEDIANAVYLLCREEANWINGAIIPVDGGERIA